jgi:hypothetical protein
MQMVIIAKLLFSSIEVFALETMFSMSLENAVVLSDPKSVHAYDEGEG